MIAILLARCMPILLQAAIKIGALLLCLLGTSQNGGHQKKQQQYALIELHVLQRTDWERIGVVNHKSELQSGTFGVAISVSKKQFQRFSSFSDAASDIQFACLPGAYCNGIELQCMRTWSL